MGFLDVWKDTTGIARIKESRRNPEIERIEIENHLKNMAQRFNSNTNMATISFWAIDFIENGYSSKQIAEVCKSIPYKFERFPTFAQINELMRVYRVKNSQELDELTVLTLECYPLLKNKFLKLLTQDQLTQMCKIYTEKIFAGLAMFSMQDQERAVLTDWLRSYFGSGQKILEQGLKTNQAHLNNDLNYFINPLRVFLKESKISNE